MSDCCGPNSCKIEAGSSVASSETCPACGTRGQRVESITVKALLNASGLRRLTPGEYRFCSALTCDVVYFENSHASTYSAGDLTVTVGQKETGDAAKVCYCFDYRVADLRQEIEAKGSTTIPKMIAAEVKAGHCACEVKNPQGTCCLGNVQRAVREIEAKRSEARVDMS